MSKTPIDVGTEAGRSYCLDLDETSTNIAPVLAYDISTFPLRHIYYGYFKAGRKHFTQRDKPVSLYQIFYTHKGCGRCIIDGREYMLKPGTIALMDFNVGHRYETYGDSWEYEWVNFTDQRVNAYYNIINPEGFTVYDLDENTEIPTLLNDISHSICLLNLKSYLHCTYLVFHLLDAFARLASSQQEQRFPRNHSRITKAMQYIDSHYMEKLTLDTLAEVALLSKYYFTHTFTLQVGISPYKYINSVRLTHARALLDNTTMSIEEIGWQVGYGGAKNFIRAFKKATGHSPNHYRNHE